MARKAWNVRTTVEALGGSVRDIAKLANLVVGHRPELAQPLAARSDALGDHKPASSRMLEGVHSYRDSL